MQLIFNFAHWKNLIRVVPLVFLDIVVLARSQLYFVIGIISTKGVDNAIEVHICEEGLL